MLEEFEDLVDNAPEGERAAKAESLKTSICADCHSPTVNMYEGVLDAAWDGKEVHTERRWSTTPS